MSLCYAYRWLGQRSLGWLFVGPWLGLIPLGRSLGLILVTPLPPSRRGSRIWAVRRAGLLRPARRPLFFVAERYRLPLMVPLWRWRRRHASICVAGWR
jgi:hypothetical protein